MTPLPDHVQAKARKLAIKRAKDTCHAYEGTEADFETGFCAGYSERDAIEEKKKWTFGIENIKLQSELSTLKAQLELALSAVNFSIDHSNDFYVVDKCKLALDRIAAMETKND
jgi:hypothetical protein